MTQPSDVQPPTAGEYVAVAHINSGALHPSEFSEEMERWRQIWSGMTPTVAVINQLPDSVVAQLIRDASTEPSRLAVISESWLTDWVLDRVLSEFGSDEFRVPSVSARRTVSLMPDHRVRIETVEGVEWSDLHVENTGPADKIRIERLRREQPNLPLIKIPWLGTVRVLMPPTQYPIQWDE